MLQRVLAYLRMRIVTNAAWGDLVQETLRNHPSVRGPREQVSIDPTALVHGAILNTESGTITIGRHAFLGDEVALLTGTHDHRQFGLDRQRAILRTGRDIVVEEGAWIASRAIVLGPCTIGKDAVVAAGAVVTGDVAPGTIVGGVPAAPLVSRRDG